MLRRCREAASRFGTCPEHVARLGNLSRRSRGRHPVGTMALGTLAETKGTRAGRAATFDSANVAKRGTREHTAFQ